MHQGLEDEKGMASALDKAPGHTTDSTAARPSRSPAMTAWQPGSEPSLLGRPLLALQRVCGSWQPDPRSRAVYCIG